MDERSADPHRWVSAHLYYHGDLDQIITHVVGPVVHEVAPRTAGGQYFFLRHWEGGPHVRLRVHARSDREREPIAAAIRRHGERYFSTHPSNLRVTAGDYQELRRQATRLEPTVTHMAELRPNNSVIPVPYHREHHKYGHGPSIDAVESHFGQSSDIARSVVGSGMSMTERHVLAFCFLVSSWSLASRDRAAMAGWIEDGGPRFDPFIPPDPDPRLGLHDGRRERLVAVARSVLDDADRDALHRDPSPTMRRRWQWSIAQLLTRLAETRTGAGETEREGRAALGVVDQCAHLACNRLGLSLGREALLRVWACEAALDAVSHR